MINKTHGTPALAYEPQHMVPDYYKNYIYLNDGGGNAVTNVSELGHGGARVHHVTCSGFDGGESKGDCYSWGTSRWTV